MIAPEHIWEFLIQLGIFLVFGFAWGFALVGICETRPACTKAGPAIKADPNIP